MGNFALMFIYEDGVVIGNYNEKGEIKCFRGINCNPNYYGLKENHLLIVQFYEDRNGVHLKPMFKLKIVEHINDLMMSDDIYDLATQLFFRYLI